MCFQILQPILLPYFCLISSFHTVLRMKRSPLVNENPFKVPNEDVLITMPLETKSQEVGGLVRLSVWPSVRPTVTFGDRRNDSRLTVV